MEWYRQNPLEVAHPFSCSPWPKSIGLLGWMKSGNWSHSGTQGSWSDSQSSSHGHCISQHEENRKKKQWYYLSYSIPRSCDGTCFAAWGPSFPRLPDSRHLGLGRLIPSLYWPPLASRVRSVMNVGQRSSNKGGRLVSRREAWGLCVLPTVSSPTISTAEANER